jgi:hypothetical protein
VGCTCDHCAAQEAIICRNPSMKEDRAAPRPAEGNTFFPCRVNICVAWGVGAACMWRSQIWRASIQHMIVELWACHAIVAAELGTSEGTACARGNQASDVITRVTRESLLHSFFFSFCKEALGCHTQPDLPPCARLATRGVECQMSGHSSTSLVNRAAHGDRCREYARTAVPRK